MHHLAHIVERSAFIGRSVAGRREIDLRGKLEEMPREGSREWGLREHERGVECGEQPWEIAIGRHDGRWLLLDEREIDCEREELLVRTHIGI